jgi:uncharacterized protein (TIGR02099 family)
MHNPEQQAERRDQERHVADAHVAQAHVAETPAPEPAFGADAHVHEHLPLAERWRRARAAYRYANLASHHVLGFTVKAVLLAYFTFMVLFLALRWAVLPNIDLYKPDIERAASRVLGNQVTISRVYASWRGLHPNLYLGDVRLRDRQGRQLLLLPSVSATLSWWSVVAGEPRFDSLEINRPELDVRRTPDGVFWVAGVRIDQNRKEEGGGGGGDWLLRQREIVIREGRLSWTDQLRAAPVLALSNVTVVLDNRWTAHRFALRATPPGGVSDPLDVRARFTHPAFARASDLTRWKGELYADLRNTDLASWKQYITYPFNVDAGRGSVRAWLNVDQARLAGFTADLGLSGVSARLAPDAPPLALARVSGRLSAREEIKPDAHDGKPTFGALGHSIGVENFSVVTADGTVLPPATLSESWRPAAHGKPERFQVRAGQLDLGALATVAAQMPLTPQQRELLAALAPRGRVLDADVEWEGHFPKLAGWRVRGQVEGIGIDPLPAQPGRAALPGVRNLSGNVDASNHGGSLNIASQKLALVLPAWFADADMPFDELGLRARWSYLQDSQLLVEVDGLDFAQGELKGSLSGRHVLPLNETRDGTKGGIKGPGNADFSGTVDGFDIATIGRWLPLATHEGLREWLTGALQGGTLHDARLRLRGDLAHFPFQAGNAAERARGEFRVSGRIENGKLDYAPAHRAPDGKAPLWPLAENINGTILFDRARMEIHADTARTLGLNLNKVSAVIPELGAHESTLDIDGAASGQLQEFLRYVATSPVLEWIGHFTEDTKATGNARLGLKLHLPLANLHDTKVVGALQLQNNDVTLFPELPPVQAALGKIEFSEHGVNLNGIGASFLGGPLQLSGGTQRDGAIVIRMAGTATADGMRATSSLPALQRLAGKLSGGARFGGSVTVKDRQTQIVLDSTLAGLGVELPVPLNKPAADALPLHFVLSGQPTGENGVAHDEIRVGLGTTMAARYVRERQPRGPWIVKRGGIGVNVPAPEPDSGMMINVNMKSVNVDRWLAAASDIAGPAEASHPGPAQASADAGQGGGMAQYVMPDLIGARTGELVIGERTLHDVVVGVSHQPGVWQASVDSRQVTGWVTWNEAPHGQGMGKVTARLASLDIPESSANEVKDLLESGKTPGAGIPALDIVAERFELFDKQFGRLELIASNAKALAGGEWRIERLAITNPDGELKANGRWLTRDGRSNTALNFNLDISDAGRLLDRLGFPGTLRRGKGSLSGDLSWAGLPYSLDIPTLSGQVQMNVEDGQFLKKDPGAAKLLGVLSLQMLPRMLKLDFHDVFSEGLAFDGITANAMISRGVVHTDNLKMHGVAATVLMDGTADIANETTNLHVVVIPEFNLGTGPLVYALAVNPVIGIGSFLAQLFLRAPMMKALTYHMQVTGPWKSPNVLKLDNQAANAAANAAAAAETAKKKGQ